MSDVTVQYNPKTGRQRIQLQDGNPIPDDTHSYAVISLLTEDPGWPMEETPRLGNLARSFREYTSGTPSRFKAAVEDRAQPLIDSGLLVDADCSTPTINPRDGSLDFTLRTQRPGVDPDPIDIQIGTP